MARSDLLLSLVEAAADGAASDGANPDGASSDGAAVTGSVPAPEDQQ